MKWYCVTSAIDNRGKVTAAITDVRERKTKPNNTFTSTSRKDIYNDWYRTEAEARQAVKDALNAYTGGEKK